MYSRSSSEFPPLPPPSGGRPGGGAAGGKEQAPHFILKGVWRNLKKAFTGKQSRHSHTASPGDPRVDRVPELDGRPLESDPQYRRPRHDAQGGYHPNMSEMPAMANTGYGPRPPPGLGRQGSAMPQQASPGTEIIIALMGVTGKIQDVFKTSMHLLIWVTGAGKSYFIREVTGNPEVAVSGDLYSCKMVPCRRRG